MRKILYILLLIGLSVPATGARKVKTVTADSAAIVLDSAMLVAADSAFMLETQLLPNDSIPPVNQDWYDTWKPDPYKAIWLGAIFPGLGQIYNRSYWKLPIVYGAFFGCAYAIRWNAGKYTDYQQAYRDILTDKELSTDPLRSYNAILPNGYTVERMGGRETYTRTLNSKQNLYRRNRDIAIVATVAVYALTLVDAFVDAQLFDFDISEDLSLNVAPELYYDFQNRQRSAEIHLAITLK